MSKLPAQPNQSLLEGIELLLAVVRRGGAVGVRELARETGLTPTRVQRYLATLAHVGLTDRQANGAYGVGPGIHALSAISLSASGLAARAMEVLPPLCGLGGQVALGVLWRQTVSYLFFHEPGRPVTRSLGQAADYPARDSSIGLAVLAFSPAERLRRDFPAEAEALAPRLQQVRTQGYTRLDRPGGVISLAVPVGEPAVAGLALTGSFCPSRIPEFLPPLREAAAALMQKEPKI